MKESLWETFLVLLYRVGYVGDARRVVIQSGEEANRTPEDARTCFTPM